MCIYLNNNNNKIIQAIKFNFYFIAMVNKGAQVFGQSGDPTDG